MKYEIGLDLGTSSVGWAVIQIDDNNELVDLIDLGSRCFEEVLDSKGKKLKNEKRRQMRMLRRNISRKRNRRRAVRHVLFEAKLIPSIEEPFADSGSTLEPYELRVKGLSEPLTPYEFSRAIYHLAQRRGYKSNRGAKLASLASEPELQEILANDLEEEDDTAQAKSDEKGEGEDTGKILAEIKSLATELNGQTLGQFFLAELQAGRKVRRRYTLRSMYEQEFERIYEAQQKHNPALTQALRAKLFHALFFQRPLKAQKFLVGKCSLEPTKKRSQLGTLTAQRFRIWSDLANLEIIDQSTGEKRSLTLEEKENLASQLDAVKSLSWTAIAKAIGYKNTKQVAFNLQKAYKEGLGGNTTIHKIELRAPGLLAKLDQSEQQTLVETILTAEDRGVLYRTLRGKYGLEVEAAYQLAIVELAPGYSNLSSKAMEKMLEQMKKGERRIDAQVACGYKPWSEEVIQQTKLTEPPRREEITSPRVRKALNQTRRIVNAIIRKMDGVRPTTIRIEMARSMSLNKKEKAALEKAQAQGKKENDEARRSLQKMGIQQPTNADVKWYRLGKQVNWECPYSGATIPQLPSAMSEFQVEHIVPREISFDDSFNNLTLSRHDYNLKKGMKTPFQAFGHTPEWPAMVERINKIKGYGSGHKRRLFLDERDPDQDQLVARQLNETRWIVKETAQFLRPLTDNIECTRGGTTHMLRTEWGLMEALYGINEKRRDDLRHHAVDAVAIVLTTRSRFMKMTTERKKELTGPQPTLLPPAPTWLVPKLKKMLESVVVSHETTRQIAGALHEETVYGKRAPGEYHYRKPLVGLGAKDLDKVIDPNLRKAMMTAMAAAQARGEDPEDFKKLFANGVPYGKTVAHRARIMARITNARQLNPIKHVVLGNNHHVAIWEDPASGKRMGVFMSMMEAAKAVRLGKKNPSGLKKSCPVDLTPPFPGARFLMWLANNDTIEFEGKIYRVQKLEANNMRLCLREVQAATVDDNDQRVLKSISLLDCRKLDVDLLGQVRIYPEGKL